jgi:phosphomannomutase
MENETREEMEQGLVDSLNSFGDTVNENIEKIVYKHIEDIPKTKELVKKYIDQVKSHIDEKRKLEEIEESSHKFSIDVVNSVYETFIETITRLEKETSS